MQGPDHQRESVSQGASLAASYLVGVAIGAAVVGLVLLFVGYRLGGPDWARKSNPWRDVVEVFSQVPRELFALGS
jgi:hypothetical protein